MASITPVIVMCGHLRQLAALPQKRLQLQQAAAQLLKKLLLGDIAVADFHRAQMNLEKVFMEVTQDD